MWLKKQCGWILRLLIITILVSVYVPQICVAVDASGLSFSGCNFKTTDSNITCLEVYGRFPNTNLTFIKKGDIFQAEAEVQFVVYDKDGEYVHDASVSQVIQEKRFNSTISPIEMNLVQFNFYLEPGEYELEMRLNDKNKNQPYLCKGKATVQKFAASGLKVSELQVATKIEVSDESSIMVKNGKKVIPNVSRIFGSDLNMAYFYFEVYDMLFDPSNQINKFTFSYNVLDADDNVVIEFSRSYEKPSDDTAINFAVMIGEYKGGAYRVKATIKDEDTGKTAENETWFQVNRSPIDLAYQDYDEVLKMLSLIAKDKELKELRKVTESERQTALISFWNSKDPTPGTETNEMMQEFYTRVSYANQNFGSSNQPGWKTDRGRIFVRFGAPDRVSSQSSVEQFERFEVWEYSSPQRQFFFVDRHGFGDYRLVNNFQY
ncbi:GWxTD domain-containing protein [candidate division KSB1 bacterium]|nr:GWxTD domain-containing protein [candidate division KSB1 bacterium]